MRALVANPDVANPPAVTIPESLPLPDTGFTVAGVDHVGRTAAMVAGGIARAVIIAVLRSDRAADNGAAKQAGGDAGRDAALRLRRRGNGNGGNGQCEGG